MYISRILIFFFVFGLSGCASIYTFLDSAGENSLDQETTHLTERLINPDPIDTRLANAAERASDSLRTLSRVNNATQEESISSSVAAKDIWARNNVPVSLERRIDIDRWSGPPESIVKSLAAYNGWRFERAGVSPRPGIIVSVSGSGRRVIDFLYDIGYQLGDRANVVISPDAVGRGGALRLEYLSQQNQTKNDWNKRAPKGQNVSDQ